MNKWLLTLLLMTLIGARCRATVQALNVVKYNGKDYFLINNDLLNGILNARSIDLKFKEVGSTACWRGYIAYFEITDNKLFLTGITSCNDPNDKADLAKLFSKEIRNGKVFLPWFTGSLNLGRVVKWLWFGQRAFDDEQAIFIENGKVTRTASYDNSRTIAPNTSIMERSSDKIYSEQLRNMVALTEKRSVSFEIAGDSLQRVSVVKYLDSVPASLKVMIQQETREKFKDWPVWYQKGKFTPLTLFMRIAGNSN